MKRSPLIEKAHRVIKHCEKGVQDYIFNSVNLTLLEKEIIIKTEIDGTDIEPICMNLESWKKKNYIRYSHCAKLKKSSMEKTGLEYNGQRIVYAYSPPNRKKKPPGTFVPWGFPVSRDLTLPSAAVVAKFATVENTDGSRGRKKYR